MKKSRIYFAIAFVSMLSCKKDKIISNADDLTFGNYTGMRVSKYETQITGGYKSPGMVDFDLDNDNAFDIRLISEVWGSPGLGHHPSSSIECLNSEIKLLGYLENDTNFLFYVKQTYPGSNNKVIVAHSYSYSCHRYSSIDSVVSIEYKQFKVSPKFDGNKILQNSNFFSDKTILIDDSYSYPTSFSNVGTDTTITYSRWFRNDCNTFPMAEKCYIGFKIGKHNVEKLGWIKLAIFDKNNILVLETAIQE